MPTNRQDLWAKYKDDIVEAIRLSPQGFGSIYGELQKQKHQSNGWTAGLCPLHDDKSPSFGYHRETGKYKCFSCGGGSVFDFYALTSNMPFLQTLNELGRDFGVERPAGISKRSKVKKGAKAKAEGPTLEQYARSKRLPLKFLENLGLETIQRYGRNAIAIPYYDKKGAQYQIRYRVAVNGGDKFRWSQGANPKNFYGAQFLGTYPTGSGSYVILCEGESDFQTLYLTGFRAIGIAGADTWPTDWARALDEFERIYICLEPDTGGNTMRRYVNQAQEKTRQRIFYIVFPRDKKDPSSVFVALSKNDTRKADFKAAFTAMLQDSMPQAVYERKHGGVKPEIFVPGEHGQTRARVGTAAFNAAVVPHLPFGETLYLHGPESVEINGRNGECIMEPLRVNRLRSIIDDHLELVEENAAGKRKFRACFRDLSAALLDNLARHDVPRIRTFSRFPVWTIEEETGAWVLPDPGYTLAVEHYFDMPKRLTKFKPEKIDPDNLSHVQRVHDLVNPDRPGPFADFPWRNQSGPINTLAAMLTLLVRPAIEGLVPLVTVTARRRRTGKTNLVQTIITLATGNPAVVAALPQNDDEFNKTIIAELRQETPAIFFDNVSARTLVDSTPLAALITAKRYGGRLLGKSVKVEYDNNSVVFLTGNNLTLSDELIQRTLPIELQPLDDAPEERKLPALAPLILKSRMEFLSVIHGMIMAWVKAKMPTRRLDSFGGFETWSETIAGILDLWDLGEYFSKNLEEWRSEANVEDDETIQFLWVWRQHQLENMRISSEGGYTAKELLQIAADADLFADTVFMRPTAGQSRALSKTVIAPFIGITKRVKDDDGSVHEFLIRRTGSAKRGYAYTLDYA